MSAAAEKQQQIVRGNNRVGSVILQQMGHRVVEVWREGDVGDDANYANVTVNEEMR